MDIRNYFYFLVRSSKKALLVGVIGALIGFGYTALKVDTSYEGIVFMSIGMQQETYPDSAEAFGARGVTEADNYFAETVQGWTMDPSFAPQVSERAGVDVGVSARKQERQNIIFQVFVADEADAEIAMQAAVDELQERLDGYNQAIQTSYAMANVEFSVLEHLPPTKFNMLVGFIFGVLFVFFGCMTREFLMGKVSFPYQVDEVLDKKSLMRMWCKVDLNKVPKKFLKDDTKLLGLGVKVKDGVDLKDLHKGDYLVFVKMGKANEKDLEFVKKVADDFEWVEVL